MQRITGPGNIRFRFYRIKSISRLYRNFPEERRNRRIFHSYIPKIGVRYHGYAHRYIPSQLPQDRRGTGYDHPRCSPAGRAEHERGLRGTGKMRQMCRVHPVRQNRIRYPEIRAGFFLQRNWQKAPALPARPLSRAISTWLYRRARSSRNRRSWWTGRTNRLNSARQ